MQSEDYAKVLTLLGSWPAPLAIFLRTPEGQMLTPDARGLIAKGLGLLGSACVACTSGADSVDTICRRLKIETVTVPAVAGPRSLEGQRVGAVAGDAERARRTGVVAAATVRRIVPHVGLATVAGQAGIRGPPTAS